MRLRAPILVQTLEVNGEIPVESDIEMAVRRLMGGRAGGLSGMHTEELKGWCREAKGENDPEWRSWELVARLV